MQKKPLPFYDVNAWVEKKKFDVTVKSWDGEEVCALVGLFLLSKHASMIGTKNVGLYKNEQLSSNTSS